MKEAYFAVNHGVGETSMEGPFESLDDAAAYAREMHEGGSHDGDNWTVIGPVPAVVIIKDGAPAE